MNNKEYRDNQKTQRTGFKKYRKNMRIVVIALLIALIPFVFTGPFAALNTFLDGFLTSFAARSITFWLQFLISAGGILVAAINTIKANIAKNNIDKAQDEEEKIVDTLINEKEKLLQEVEELKKQKVVVSGNTNQKDYHYQANDNEYSMDNVKVKKYTR